MKMATKTISSFGVDPITTHAWSSDGMSLALSQNNKEVKIFKEEGHGKWAETALLDQHDLRVTGIDWAPKTNRIVTCSADRNAYVWNLNSDGTWKQNLVLLRINRAATCVKWSPEENKFAVGSGARYYAMNFRFVEFRSTLAINLGLDGNSKVSLIFPGAIWILWQRLG